MKIHQEFSQAEKNEKINKLKEKTAILRIILMQLMTTEQIEKLPKKSVVSDLLTTPFSHFNKPAILFF